MKSKLHLDTYVIRDLGLGQHQNLIISSALLVMIFFFYSYVAGSYFGADTFPLQHRSNDNITFDTHVVEENVDKIIVSVGTFFWLALTFIGRTRILISSIYGVMILVSVLVYHDLLDVVALISVPIVISSLIFNRFFHKILNSSAILLSNYTAIAGIVIGVLSIIITLATSLTEVKLTNIHDYAYDIFLLFSIISPALIFFLIISSPFKLLIKRFVHKPNETKETGKDYSFFSYAINSRTRTLLILSFMFLAVIIGLIPHQPAINNDNALIGADTGEYLKMTDSLIHKNNFQEFIGEAFVTDHGGDRPITLIFLTALAKIIPDDLPHLIDHAPLVLGPLLVLIVYFLTRELTSNETSSIFASFLTAISFQSLIGIYSGIYANWLALIFGYLSFVFLIRYLKYKNGRNLALYGVLLVLTLFSHVYTWTILALVTGVFLAVLYKLNQYQKKSLVLLLLILLCSIGIDIIRTHITGSLGGIETDISIANQKAGLQQVLSIWQNLSESIRNYSGGQFSNFLILTLGIYWIFRSNSRDFSTIFLLVFLSIGIIPLFFGNVIIQTRVLYDIPFQIPAAIALTYLWKKPHFQLAIWPICIWVLAMSIKAISNFA